MKKFYDPAKYGYVFNIQQFSVHDGPGIRTIVFLKGCPLKCPWCSNPESQKLQPELAYNNNKCIGITECLRCIDVCVTGAIKKANDNRILIDRGICDNCLACADACPARALNIFGSLMSIADVLQVVEEEGVFYARSGGGITLSGGEPLLQGEFCIALLKEAKKRKMNTAIETCGYADWSVLEEACQYLDTVIYDIKSMDSVKHQHFTGVSNELILTNFQKMSEKFPDLPILVRTPVIPGFNDNQGDISSIIKFIKGRSNVKYELLGYHRLGQPKYQYLGKEYPLGDVRLSDEKLKEFKKLADF